MTKKINPGLPDSSEPQTPSENQSSHQKKSTAKSPPAPDGQPNGSGTTAPSMELQTNSLEESSIVSQTVSLLLPDGLKSIDLTKQEKFSLIRKLTEEELLFIEGLVIDLIATGQGPLASRLGQLRDRALEVAQLYEKELIEHGTCIELIEDLEDSLMEAMLDLRRFFVSLYEARIVRTGGELNALQASRTTTAKANIDYSLERLDADRTDKGIEEEPKINNLGSQAKSGNTPQKEEKVFNIKDRFEIIEQAQVLFDGKDLNLPTGLCVEVFKKLHDKYGRVVQHKVLHSNVNDKESAASFQLREVISYIRKGLADLEIPCKVEIKTREGYKLADDIKVDI